MHKEKVFLTDHLDSDRIDAVFPLCFENRYFVDNLDIVKGNIVLDLCTGSGIIAIFAADKADKVVAADNNLRALEFARFNAALNGVDGKIDFREGDLFEPVNGMKFDAILVNPPFEPTPEGCHNYTHSDGGIDGLRIIYKIISQVTKYLSKNGVFQMIALLPNYSKKIISILSEKFQEVKIKEVRKIEDKTFHDYQYRRLTALNHDKLFRATTTNNTLRLVFIKAKGIKD